MGGVGREWVASNRTAANDATTGRIASAGPDSFSTTNGGEQSAAHWSRAVGGWADSRPLSKWHAEWLPAERLPAEWSSTDRSQATPTVAEKGATSDST